MVEVAIVGAMRTAIGGFGGTLKSVEASTLGGTVIAAAMAETGLPAPDVDEVIMGCIYQGGAGPNVARQAAVRGGSALRGSRHDRQQTLRFRTQVDRPGCSERTMRGRRTRHCWWYGEHE